MGRLPLLAVVAFVIAGCTTGTVRVDTYPTTKGSGLDCAAMFGDLPPTVAGQERRLVEDGVAGAWGDPPIILRCGVEKPTALKPTSECHEVNGVGWLAEQESDGFVFTTIGRKHYASLEVPADYEPAADALADIAPTIGKHLPSVRPCA